MSESENILIKESQNGSIESFEKLIDKYQLLAFNIAYKMIGNREDASDAAQEALVKVFKSIKKFKGDSSFSTWLYRIVTNTCIDMTRKNNKLKTYSLNNPIETEDGNIEREVRDEGNLPEDICEKKEINQKLHRAIGKLPEKYRVVIILRDIEDFTYDEISEITNITLGTVKSRISRARLMLKEILTEERELFLER